MQLLNKFVAVIGSSNSIWSVRRFSKFVRSSLHLIWLSFV